MKRSLPLLLAIGLLSACSGMQTTTPAGTTDATQMKVSASFYPLAYIAEEISGNTAVVTQVIPSGVEPHDYEPNPQQLSGVYDSTVLIMNGGGLDPWAEKSKNQLISKGITIVTAMDFADVLSAIHEEEEGHDEKHEAEEHEHGEFDPHVWLDPIHMITVAQRVRDAFIARDPTNSDVYQANTNTLIDQLKKLDERFRSNLRSCKKNKAIVSHDAFRYLARRYNFETVALSGISPDEEPSPKKIAEIIETAKQEGLKVVFFETLVSPKLAESVAKGAGAKTLVLNPIEGLSADDRTQGKSYLSIMQENADNLAIALECQQ